MNFRDLDVLQNRIQKIRTKKRPPRLRCIVLNPGEKEPDDLFISTSDPKGNKIIIQDPFALLIKVEEMKDPPGLN